MPALQTDYITILGSFARLFSDRIWKHAKILLMGAILSPAERTVAAALRATGLSMEQHFQNYHRVLNRAKWSSLEASRILLGLLIHAFANRGPVILGLDDTIERRRGVKIKAKGIYRDPVRSSHSHFVKASGLRWLSLMLLTPIPWAGRTWALPFLTVLAPSERYYQGKARRHKKLTEWAHQVILQARHWLPKRLLVVVADSSFAVIELLWQLRQLKNPVAMIVRFRMDAALYEPAKNTPGQMGRPRKKGKRLPTLGKIAAAKPTRWKRLTVQEGYGEKKRKIEITSGTAVWFHVGKPALPIRWVIVRDPKKRFKTQALLCTDLTISAEKIVQWFPRRWADLSILRITPALLSLFSLVTLLANAHARKDDLPVQQTAWYTKKLPTFSDALTTVKQNLYSYLYFQISPVRHEVQKSPPIRSAYRYARSMHAFFHVSFG
jgi:hypothetical protein